MVGRLRRMSYVDRIWDKTFFPVEAPEVLPSQERPCPDSLLFERWCQQWCSSLASNPSRAAIRKKKLLLQDRYWDFYHRADKACREHTSDEYYCIFHVYRDWFEKLDLAELALQPPEEYFLEPHVHKALLLAAAKEEEERKREEKKTPALYVGADQEQDAGDEA
jgi:hypothetical protein